MALFGEKYGEWVRVVEVADVSRELCGGTHVANTAEVGIFKIVSEGSSAANVRRVEAITGPAAIDWFRGREADLGEVGTLLGNPQDPVAAARRAAQALAEAGAGAEQAQRQLLGEEARRLAGGAAEFGGVQVANRVQSSLGGATAVVLGGGDGEKVALVALVSQDAVGRGLSAAALVREAAAVVGGGGGGREDMAQAGGRDPSKLGDALAAARAAIERELGG
jgi:alanyl-tRNA synthetase